jgi:uncharacterized membrane protein
MEKYMPGQNRKDRAISLHQRQWLPEWRRDALRTTLWIVPALLVAIVSALFGMTYLVDRLVYDGQISLPPWINTGGADAGRQILIAIAAAVITVAGVVFSVVIVALTLASQQFGPRILRNFIRDRGTQFTLGIFVATFVYSVLALGSITSGSGRDFVPHISISVALGLLLADLVVLIYFIHHVATSIQLNEVVASIGGDLVRAIDIEAARDRGAELSDQLLEPGPNWPGASAAEVSATRSGYLGAVNRRDLVALAIRWDAVIRLLYRPGHFVVAGRPMALVSPPEAAPSVASALDKAHITGRHRTLSQDMLFAVDQLVEIAIRALSPAVNDTFTAMTCVDWLTAGLCRVSSYTFPEREFHDGGGAVRLIEPGLSYKKVVDRAFDKIRQAGRGMPAIAIRQLDSLNRVVECATSTGQRQVLLVQADMILRASEEAVAEERDRQDVRASHDKLLRTVERIEETTVLTAEIVEG